MAELTPVIPGQLTLFDVDAPNSNPTSPPSAVTASVGLRWVQRCRDLLAQKRRELWRIRL